MRADDWMIDYLIKQGCTDVFGIPGVVVMDFLYAVDRRKPEITPHLSYHEQGGSFAACGYAQVAGRMGVAYSTRGPGFTNMITAIADAYYDSVPTMFITAHSAIELNTDMRVLNNQEIDTICMVKNVTKYAKRIDKLEEFQKEISLACRLANEGRKGPVFLDIYNQLFAKEVDSNFHLNEDKIIYKEKYEEVVDKIEEKIQASKRPIILIGNGVRGSEASQLLDKIAYECNIPILSSRVAQDIIPNSKMYYGFVGSRATRYSNFILSKADLIISIGNRMSFPLKSKSFSSIIGKTEIIRVDIDNAELQKDIPNCLNYQADALGILDEISKRIIKYEQSSEWISICDYLREKLNKWDINSIVDNLMNIMKMSDEDMTYICDVGNHSFWVTTAYAYALVKNRILYSGSFGTLGSALPKSIGAYYSTKKPVICFTGDQGIQFNIQELQYISKYQLPITIIIINNSSSGMIMEREKAQYGDYLIHTTLDDGYSYPNFEKIALCYDINYLKVDINRKTQKINEMDLNRPGIIEMIVNRDTELTPRLPIGNPCQNLSPELPKDLYWQLDIL